MNVLSRSEKAALTGLQTKFPHAEPHTAYASRPGRTLRHRRRAVERRRSRKKLLDGAVATLLKHGIADESIDVAWVPGSFEIPLVAQRMAASEEYAAVLCLGAVIQRRNDARRAHQPCREPRHRSNRAGRERSRVVRRTDV